MSEATHITRRITQTEADQICARHDRLWSSKPGGARAVFAWADLSGLDLTGRTLCDADFSGAVLAGCQMRGARLDHAIMFGADLQDTDLREASLRRADLRGACLHNADLAAADPKYGFRRIEAGGAPRIGDAQGAKLVGANLERSKLSGVIAVRADFTDAILKDARLVRANLKQATMKGCNLSGA